MPAKTRSTVRSRKAKGAGGKELARLRKILSAIDGSFEKLSHGEPTWFVGPKGRCFAMFDNHHHGAEHISVYFPTPPEVQQALIASNPDRYWSPPYVGKSGWTAVILSREPDWSTVERLARESFARISARR